MTRNLRAITVRQIAALLSIAALALFMAAAQVNFLDNLQHLSERDQTGHSVFSIVETGHHHDGTDHDQSQGDSNIAEHHHPHACGAVLYPTCALDETHADFAETADLSWRRFEQLPDHLSLALERPPRV